MAAIQDAILVGHALQMALARRCPQAGLLHHSDRGSTYTSDSYITLVQQNSMVMSMSRTANCYDNAVTESFASLASKVNALIARCFIHELKQEALPSTTLKPFIIELVGIPPYNT